MAQTAGWLAKAGLSRFALRFAAEGFSDEQFLGLKPADYARFGLEAAADRLKMDRLVRSLRPAEERAAEEAERLLRTSMTGLGDGRGEEAAAEAREGGSSPASGALTVARSPPAPTARPQEDPGLAGLPPLPGAQPARIRVLVRKRPLNAKERRQREADVVAVQGPAQLAVHEARVKVDLTQYAETHRFVFDEVLDEGATGDAVYAAAVEPLLRTVFSRGKASVFAYGQTGSGKTHTMSPLPVRCAGELLATIERERSCSGLRLTVSYFEIYGGRVFDLLASRTKLTIRESGSGEICVVGLREYRAEDVPRVAALIDHGNAARSTGSTGANADSSRSHAVLQLCLRRGGGDEAPLHGKFSFIDLAGSERGADTSDNDRQTRLEGAEINKSLLALKECIRALDQERSRGERHIPFRGSKLTEVLRDSFGGDGRTVMIATISPASGSCEHTLNTLRYADRVKELRRPATAPAAPDDPTQPQQQPQPPRSPRTSPPPPLSVPQVLQPAGPGRRLSAGAAPAAAPPPPRPPRPPTPGPPAESMFSPLLGGPGLSLASPLLTPASARPHHRTGSAGGGGGGGGYALGAALAGDEDEALLAAAHEELMVNILSEEDDVVAAHKRAIEDTMASVRDEMALLAAVERPGSKIDDYVGGLGAILDARLRAVADLQERVHTLQRHVKEEEILSRTLGGGGGAGGDGGML